MSILISLHYFIIFIKKHKILLNLYNYFKFYYNFIISIFCYLFEDSAGIGKWIEQIYWALELGSIGAQQEPSRRTLPG